jgi:hypothetical protein
MRRLTVTTLVLLAFATPAVAGASEYETGGPSPALLCWAAKQSALSAIEATLRPASVTEVSVGATVVFSASAAVPVTFKVAANPALAPPLIDEGTAAPVGGTVSFSSRSASSSGVVYWNASFSTAALPDCASFMPESIASPARTLNVLAAPAAPAAVETAPTSTAPVTSMGCAVPKLRGMSLAAVRASLRRHGCRLGRVAWPAGSHAGPLVVTRQGLAPGSRRPSGTAITVTLGRARQRKGDHR